MIKILIKKVFNSMGLEISRNYPTRPELGEEFPVDFEQKYINIIKKVKPFTMTSNERLYQLILCVKYIIENDIKGDFVECGVWRGGSILTIIETLKLLGVTNRKVHLFDTFKSEDIFSTKHAINEDEPFNCSLEDMNNYLINQKLDLSVNLSDVKELMKNSDYPLENIVFNVGRVEETLPKTNISEISLLRLDTDWYDSTKFQLEHLYHKVTTKGVVIFDDYGFWKGHKKAVDEFLSKINVKPLLFRNDGSCRLLIKNM